MNNATRTPCLEADFAALQEQVDDLHLHCTSEAGAINALQDRIAELESTLAKLIARIEILEAGTGIDHVRLDELIVAITDAEAPPH